MRHPILNSLMTLGLIVACHASAAELANVNGKPVTDEMFKAVLTKIGPQADVVKTNPEMRKHSTDIRVTEVCTTVSFTPALLGSLSAETQHRFDRAFIGVLVRRLHAAHDLLAHPRRIL